MGKKNFEQMMNLRVPIPAELSDKNIKALTLDNLVYAEYAGGGAMGNAGTVTIYFFERSRLYYYEASLFTEKKRFEAAVAFLLECDPKKLKYIDGGMGNHVFIHSKFNIEKGKSCLFLLEDGKKHVIWISVTGVFERILNSAELRKNKKGNK